MTFAEPPARTGDGDIMDDGTRRSMRRQSDLKLRKDRVRISELKGMKY
jgi:hypothetical protein